MKRRPTLAIDFDGVLHAYSNGWQDGSCYDEPVAGTGEALRRLNLRYKLVVFTARHDLEAVAKWLIDHHIRHFFADITNRKPAAFAYLDDRGIRFEGAWTDELLDMIERAAK